MDAAHAPEASFAIGTLEFDAVREQLARHTSFSAGRELALTVLPSSDVDEARRRLAATGEALRLPGLRPGLHLGGVHDVRPHAERASVGGLLGPEELLDVASTGRSARAWRRGLASLRHETPTLLELAEVFLGDHSGLVEDIQDAIGEGGDVLDSASPALGRLRAELRGAHDRLVSRLREIMSAPPYRDLVQDPVVTQRAGRYVIPIRAESRGQAPGIVHDQSASGATLFVEPLAVVEMGNRWRTLILDEEREVERILRALSQEVGAHADALLGTVEGLAQIDLARARAALAEQQRASLPELVRLPRPDGEPGLRLPHAPHPLLSGA
ncbi:MAG: endonuclease MutS2, partial [Chloroflexota bacterium]